MPQDPTPNPLLRPLDILLLLIVALGILLRNWRATWLYMERHRRLPRIAVPRSFNNKVFWRKIVDRNPLFVTFNDKVEVRGWVRERAPELAQTTLYWRGSDPREIPDEALQQPAMLKANHGSGFNTLYDPDTMSRDEVVQIVDTWLGQSFGVALSEWAYGEIPRQGLLEELLAYSDGSAPDNLNVHCCDGEVMFVGVYTGNKQARRQIGFFDGKGRRLPLGIKHTPPLPEDFEPSETMWQAMEAAKGMSRGLDYARCDFMGTEQDIWFNEVTTYTGSGHLVFSNPSLIGELQDAWDLRKSWFLSTPQKGLAELYRKALVRELTRRGA